MDILYFSSGMLTVAFLYAVVGVFKLKQQVKQLENFAEDIQRQTDQNLFDTSRHLSEQADEIYRFVDSRVDKLEARLTKNS